MLYALYECILLQQNICVCLWRIYKKEEIFRALVICCRQIVNLEVLWICLCICIHFEIWNVHTKFRCVWKDTQFNILGFTANDHHITSNNRSNDYEVVDRQQKIQNLVGQWTLSWKQDIVQAPYCTKIKNRTDLNMISEYICFSVPLLWYLLPLYTQSS